MQAIFKLLLASFVFLSIVACSAGSTDTQYVAQAQDYIDKGDLNSATIELKNALVENPDNAQARWLLGKLQLEAGDVASAEKELRKAHDLGIVDGRGDKMG